MKTIIAGSRSIWSYHEVDYAIAASGFHITQVICGMAQGVDSVGWAWAMVNGVPVIECPADWDAHGKSAGHIRNANMAKQADALVAIYDGTSRGTASMIKIAERAGLRIYVHKLTPVVVC